MPTSPKLDPGLHKELFLVTDGLRELRTNPSSFTVDGYRALLNQLCGALSASLENGLEQVIRYVSDLTLEEGTRAEAKAIVADVGTFLKFIQFEEEALMQCGASKHSAKEISLEIASLRDHLTTLPYDGGVILENIRSGRAAICRAAEEVSTALDKEIAHFEDAKRTMLTYGIAVSFANAAATAITLGAAAPFAALSGCAGGILIHLRGVLRNPATRQPGR